MFYSGADPVTLLNDVRELGQACHRPHGPGSRATFARCRALLPLVGDPLSSPAAIRRPSRRCSFRGRRLRRQYPAAGRSGASVALLGSVPAETFEMFRAECEDHLERIERDALALEADPASRDNLDSLFRAVHSIKGNAGLLLGHVTGAALGASHPLQLLLRVAHAMESLLDPFRAAIAGLVPDETIQTALETCDAIRILLKSLTNESLGAAVSPNLLERLGIRIDANFVMASPQSQIVDSRAAAFLNTTSQCVEMIAGCFLRLDEDGEALGPILETYRRGLRTWSAAAQYQKCQELEEPLAQQLLILDAAVRSGAALGSAERALLGTAFQSARSVVGRMASPDTSGDLPSVTELAGAPQSAAKPSAVRVDDSAAPSTIRIEQNKLDRLMRVVGELLVARGAFPLLVQKLNEGASSQGLAKDLKEAGSNISRIADELQTSVMSIRMLPVKTVFQRFPRLVRDLARSLGKEVRLVIEGEAIELDKTILEQIGDPLVHVIRNAVDHGLEAPEERLASGKTAAGQVILRASHEAGGVVIEVTEDGRGIDADALKRKAVEKGLLTREAADGMTEEAAFQLVFLPGLTTAAKLTDVSGRGVGMDVVRSNVRNLQGTIEIRSKRGQGTTFLIKLPTSLMVSKGILLNAGGEEYILPLSNIYDMVKLPRAEAHEYHGFTLAQVRERFIPYSALRRCWACQPRAPELSVVIVKPARSGMAWWSTDF